MSLASGSIDLKSLKVAGEGASKYITAIDGGGIKVHDVNNVNVNYALIDAEGMEVFQGDTTANSISVAKFGAVTRIGAEGDANITIDSDSIIGVGESEKEFFKFSNSSTELTTNLSQLCYNNKAQYFTGSKTFALNSVPTSGTSITLYFGIADVTGGVTLQFTAGTSSNNSMTKQINNTRYNFSAYYDSDTNKLTTVKITPTLNIANKLTCIARYSSVSLAPSFTMGSDLTASGAYSYAVGSKNTASGNYSYAQGYLNSAEGNYSHSEGYYTTASELGAHAEGNHTTASGKYSHAEGCSTTASGNYSHAEGYSLNSGGNSDASTNASGTGAHAEGYNTKASGNYSHVQGYYCKAIGMYSHAEGENNEALSRASHAQGRYTKATQAAQTVIGRYNKLSTTGSGTDADPYVYDAGDYAFIIGNGSDNTTAGRSNALTVDWNGGLTTAGGATIGGNTTINGNLNITGQYQRHGNTYIITDSIPITSSTSIPGTSSSSDSYKSITSTVANTKKDGYTLIGVTGYNIQNADSGGANSSHVMCYGCYIDSSANTVTIKVRNLASSTAVVKINARCLYRAN